MSTLYGNEKGLAIGGNAKLPVVSLIDVRVRYGLDQLQFSTCGTSTYADMNE